MKALILLCLCAATVEGIKCYSGFKYVVTQKALQDEEECNDLLSLTAYCYKFIQESSVNEVVKYGCTKTVCNAVQNSCFQGELFGMSGTVCCCNDHNFCNGARRITSSIGLLFFLILCSAFARVLAESV